MIRRHEAFVGSLPGGARAIARLVIAHGLRLDRKRLTDIDLTGADLTGSSFRGANLDRASLYCANLTNCDFAGASLKRADFRGARLVGARLNGANLDEADMRPATLLSADSFGGLNWIGGGGGLGPHHGTEQASVPETNAHSADFSHCVLRGARLRGANLKFASFIGADLTGADLKGANLHGAILRDAILCRAEMGGARVSAEALAEGIYEPTETVISRAAELLEGLLDMDRWARSGGAEGAVVMLDGEDLRPLSDVFSGKALPGISMRRAMAIGVDFRNTLLVAANFSDADLRSADFRGADLRGANFDGADLGYALFEGADLGALKTGRGVVKPITFSNANLAGAIFRTAAAG